MTNQSAPIVVAYDASESARAAADAVAGLAGDRPVHVISVWDSVAAVAAASLVAVPASITREATRELDAAAEQAAAKRADEGAEILRRQGVQATGAAIQSHGNTWSSIVKYVSDADASMVAVGSRGQSSVKAALLGSVSSGVVHHCPRPVLVVRAPEGE